MDKLSLNPSKVRGYGNVLEEKSETDASLLYSHLSAIGRDNVGGIQSKVFVMEYINNDLYFSDYPLLCIKGEDYAFEVTSTGSGDVTLYDGSTSLGTETISDGVATFTDISFSTAGIHTIYATKSSIKSGNIVVNVVDINSISGDFMMAAGVNSTHPHSTTAYIDEQTLRFQILDPNNQPIANVPVSITVGSASAVSRISDSDGFVSVDYTGHGTGDIGVTVVCGNVSTNFTIHDVEFGIYNGRIYGSYDGIGGSVGGSYGMDCNFTFNTEGFTVTPMYSGDSGTYLFDNFKDVIVDFTYLTNTGHFPVNFIIVGVSGTSISVIAQFIYQSALGKYGLYCMQNGSYSVKYTSALPLNRGDRFTIELDGTSLSISRNGTSLISGTTRSYDSIAVSYGFAVASNQSNTYDKFMIRPSSSIVVPTVSSVGLTAASQSIYIDGSTSLSATVSMSDSSSASGKVVSFYDGDTLLGTGTCNSSGVASYTFSPSATGSHSLKAVCESVESSAVSVSVSKKAPTITLATSSASVELGGSYTLSGNLSFGGSALASATVKLYKSGGTLIDTLTTDSSGNYSKSFTGSETTNYYTVFEGTTVYSDVTSSNVTVTVGKPTPTLTIASNKSSVSYGETYTISGALTYASSGISGATVKLYKGQTLVDTLTTDSNGAVSKTLTGSSTGTFSYTLVFEGDSSYASVTSSSVSVTVNLISTTVTLATDSASVEIGDTFTLSGALTDANSTPLTSASVDIYEENEGLIESVTTDSDGEFILIVESADLGTGSFSFYAQFDAPLDSPYTGSISDDVAVTITSVTPVVSSIALTSDKSILSYADSESATLSATVLDSSSNPVQGATVEFFKGSTSLGTASTNSSGVATKTYASAGAGDVSFTAAVGSLVSVSYVIEDCLLYNTWSQITSNWTTDTSVSGRTIYKQTPNYQSDVELSFKFKDSVPSNFLVGFGETGTGSPIYWTKMMWFNSSNTLKLYVDNDPVECGNPSKNANTVFKLITTDLHTIYAYTNNTVQVYRTTNSSRGLNLRIDDFSSTMELDYFKVKPKTS